MGDHIITAVVADDDYAIMRCVGVVLEREEDVRIVGQTTHAQAAVAIARHAEPQVVLMDVHMPGADPFVACREIVDQSKGQTRVLFYTAFPRDQYLDRAIQAGAAGMVSKHTESMRSLAAAMRHVIAGNQYFSPELARRLVEESPRRSRLSTLTHREVEVLRGIAHGRTQPQVAEDIGVSERTVHMEVRHLRNKLNLSSTHEMILFAVNEGLAFPELQPC